MNQVAVTVPGKIMLAGEYAVLQGGAALASTIDAYLTVTASSNAADDERSGFIVASDLWNESVKLSPKSSMLIEANPLLETVKFCMDKFSLKQGRIDVKSKLTVNYGVGSSSAIRLGVLFAMNALNDKNSVTNGTIDQELGWELARHGYKLQKQQQSFASGYDFATQLLGGTVLLRSRSISSDDWPGTVGRFSSLQPGLQILAHPFVGGRGAATKPVTLDTMQWLTKQKKWDALNTLSEELVEAFVAAMGNPDVVADKTILIELCAAHRQLFADSPHQPRHLMNVLENLSGCDKTWGFKTTGAGGEDALLLVGSEEDLFAPRMALQQAGWERLPHGFSNNPIKIVKGNLH